MSMYSPLWSSMLFEPLAEVFKHSKKLKKISILKSGERFSFQEINKLCV